MTKETYDKYNKVGKHEKQWYSVWRVLCPGGPEETVKVYGLDAALRAVIGCWNWQVKDMNGNIVPDKKIIFR